MPNFGGKSSKPTKKNSSKEAGMRKRSKKSKESLDPASVDEPIVPSSPVARRDSNEGSAGRTTSEAPKAPKATPFSDGLFSAYLRNAVIIPSSTQDDEIDLFKQFLDYYSKEGVFVGSIVNKTSFMKNKGGRLM